MGYSCQPVSYAQTGVGEQTAYACLPPLTTGLGSCQTASGGSFYAATGGLMNAAWIEAASKAGGGTPLYQIYTEACPGLSGQFHDHGVATRREESTGFTL